MDYRNLRSVKQLAEANPAFTEASLRWMIFNAEKNGLNRALVKRGRRILIDLVEFELWLEEQRVAKVAPANDQGGGHVAA